MSGTILNQRLHSFPSLSNMFIIKFFKVHNVTSHRYNISRRIVLSNKSIFPLSPRINTIFRQRKQPFFSFSPQGERKKLELNNISIYILILLHLTKFNKAIKMGSRIIRASTRKLLSHHKIQQSRLNFIKGSIRSRWRNRSAYEIIVVGASEVTQLGILSRVHFGKGGQAKNSSSS